MGYGSFPQGGEKGGDLKWIWDGKERRPYRNEEFPTGEWAAGPNAEYVNIQVSGPPRREAPLYVTFGKELL